MRKILLLGLLTLFVLISFKSFSCTTAIISGKYTPDGRPVLWKHRDTGFLKNKLMYFTDGKYDYIGLVNSVDTNGTQVWAGTNSKGFAIMNAALYDVNLDDTTDYSDREGYVMKKALQQCATVEDFEKMLKEMDKPLGVASSFGVIDAEGGAAYFETDNYNYVKYSANNPKIAPHGYIIRSNYSYRGKRGKGYGYIRYQNAHDLFNRAYSTNSLGFRKVIRDFSRSTYHSLLDKDFKTVALESNKNPHFINAEDLIVRNSSSSAVVIHGVKENEAPEFTTMWTLLGYPFTTVACPAWVAGGNNLPEIVTSKKNNAPLCNWALELKGEAYPIQRGSGYKYMNIKALYNSEQTGITQKLKPVERSVFQHTKEKMSKWRKSGMKKDNVQQYYHWLNNYVQMKYSELFGLE
jgi:hypothetical protein